MMANPLIILLLFTATAYATPDHFQLWFPQYGATFERYMAACMTTYDAYRNNEPCHPVDYGGCQSGRMVHCLLSQATESLKANMASASVVLGILPTTLGLVGSTTAETGFLALRRPLLSLLLACGTPAVSPVRTFEYRDPIDLLRTKHNSINVPKFKPKTAAIIVILQYVLALLAVANLAHVSWELSVKTVCSFSSDSAFQPALWGFLALVIHFAGCLAVVLRFHCQSSESTTGERTWARRIKTEFQLTALHSPATLHCREETYFFIFCSWCTSTGTVLHIMYGTLVFSSILFISAQDSVKVAIRYLFSTLICRVILMFEIMGMRYVMETQADIVMPRNQS